MKKFFLPLLLLASVALCRAADTKPIEEVFVRYWSAFAKGDYVRAAADILPSDLDEAKDALLPVFIAAQAKPDPEVQEMVKVFFGRAVGKARETISSAEVFAGLSRLIAANDPNLAEALKEAKVEVIIVRTPEPDVAEVHYQIALRVGGSDTDADLLARKNGRWWMRVTSDAKEIAAQVKARIAK